MLVCLAGMIYFFIGVFDIQTSVKMMRFYSPNAEIIAHYGELEETLGPLVPMEVVIKFDNTRCQFNTLERLRFIEKVSTELQAKLANEVGGLMSACIMTPPSEKRGKPGSNAERLQEYALNGRLEKYRSDLKDFITVEGNTSLNSETLGLSEHEIQALEKIGIHDLRGITHYPKNGELYDFLTADEMTEIRQKARQWETKYGTDIWRISLRVWALKKDIDYALFVNDVKNVVNPMIDEFLKEQFPKESFPAHEPLVLEAKKGILGQISNYCVSKWEQARILVGQGPEPAVEPDYPVQAVFTGMVPVVYKTQHELIAGLVDSLVSAFLLIMVVMALILKSPVAGFLAMIPNLFPVIVVFGFMGHAGILVDVGTMMTASVAMGIAVDNTIHFLTWFRAGIDQGCQPREAVLQSYKRCATAMTETTLIGGLGLSAFAFSTFTPTQMFGVMMLAMLSTSLVGDLVFLPSILTGPAGRFFMPKRKAPLDYPDNVAPNMQATVDQTEH